MAIFFLYLKILGGSIFGTYVSLFLKNRANQKTADKGVEIDYGFKKMWEIDRRTIINTFMTMFFFVILFGGGINSSLNHTANTPEPFVFDLIWISRRDFFEIGAILLFATLSYMGMDAALKLFGKSSEFVKDKLANSIPTTKTGE